MPLSSEPSAHSPLLSLPTAVDTLLRDLRFALRQLARAPGFTLAAILTLGIGIGANTTIFSVVNAALLRPPAGVADPDRLVWLYTSDYSGPDFGASSFPDYEEFRQQDHIFDGVFAVIQTRTAIWDGDTAEPVGAEIVSENYFDVVGVRPAVGRFFTPDEGRPGAPAVAVISDALFERRFARDRSTLERPITIQGHRFTVVGVAPPGFGGTARPLAADLWMTFPAALAIGQADGLEGRDNRGIFVVGRLRDGVTLESARSSMSALATNLFQTHPEAWRDVTGAGRRISILPEREARIPPQVRGPALGFVALLMATVGVLLLVCCSNVAGLLLARAAGRGREIGIRLSLGATRVRLVRQLLTESFAIAAIGTAAGFFVASWATAAVIAMAVPANVQVGIDLSPDARVIAFTIAAMIATALLCGLAPAMRVTRPDIVSVLKTEGGTIDLGGRRITLQKVLVVGQVTLSTLLLVICGLFLRAITEAASIDPGFRIENLLLADVTSRPGAPSGLPSIDVMNRLQAEIDALPGVRSASWGEAVPLALDASRRGTRIEGYQPQQGEDMEFHFNVVGPIYFETMEIPIARGRAFTDLDRAGTVPVMMVNEAFARRFWPNADPIGKRVSFSGPSGPWVDVVGVTRDGRYLRLTEPARPYMFLPALQRPGGTTLHIRTFGDPMDVLPGVRERLQAISPEWTLSDVRTMTQQLEGSLLPQRVAGFVLALFGSVALILVAIGVYGTVAYAVATRTREIGIRIALGAPPAQARRLILTHGLSLVGIGIALALPLAWGVGRLLGAFLLGGSGSDPMAFAGAIVASVAVALLAMYAPGRRASRVDPMVALRAE